LAVLARAPNTLSREGATATLAITGADETCLGSILTAALATGCAVTKARWGTAVTAPGTVRLAYVMLLTVVLFLLMFVLLLLMFVELLLLTIVVL
jgi:hypothetical protein